MKKEKKKTKKRDLYNYNLTYLLGTKDRCKVFFVRRNRQRFVVPLALLHDRRSFGAAESFSANTAFPPPLHVLVSDADDAPGTIPPLVARVRPQQSRVRDLQVGVPDRQDTAGDRAAAPCDHQPPQHGHGIVHVVARVSAALGGIELGFEGEDEVDRD